MQKLLLLILLSNFILQGCSTPPPPPVEDPRVRVTAPFKWDVSIISFGERANKGGMMEMQVELFNKSGGVEELLYSVEWYDEQGFKIDSILNAWQEIEVVPNTSYAVTAVAPKYGAKNFHLRVQRKDDREVVAAVDSRLR